VIVVIAACYPQVAGADVNFIHCFLIHELNGFLLYVFIHVILFSMKFDVMFEWTRLEKFYILS